MQRYPSCPVHLLFQSFYLVWCSFNERKPRSATLTSARRAGETSAARHEDGLGHGWCKMGSYHLQLYRGHKSIYNYWGSSRNGRVPKDASLLDHARCRSGFCKIIQSSDTKLLIFQFPLYTVHIFGTIKGFGSHESTWQMNKYATHNRVVVSTQSKSLVKLDHFPKSRSKILIIKMQPPNWLISVVYLTHLRN